LKIFRHYNPEKYWKKRGIYYKDQFKHSNFFQIQENFLLNYLKKIKFKTVLEFGCGFGRITKIILSNFEISNYHAIDISPDQIENAKKELGELARSVNFEVSDFSKISFEKEKYDLVIGVEVLMHVKPNDIKNVIQNFLYTTKKHFINVDFYQNPAPVLDPHNFVHQYLEIFGKVCPLSKRLQLPVGNTQFLFQLEK